MSLVLDSSATLAWIYSDETTAAIQQLFDTVANTGAIVPMLWRLEVANSLTVAMRRGRIDAAFRRAALTIWRYSTSPATRTLIPMPGRKHWCWPIAIASR